MAQHRLEVPIGAAITVARIMRMDFHPQDPRDVTIVYALGEFVGGAWVERERRVKRVIDAPPALAPTIATLEAAALAYLVANGDLPAGTRE